MIYITEQERQIPVTYDVDLLICGGGVAGWAAALSAARLGASVFLVERYGFLGGEAVSALVLTVPPLNNGICRELADRLQTLGAIRKCKYPAGEVADWLERGGLGHGMEAFDPEILKHEMVTMLQQKNVRMLLHTYVVDSIVEDNVLKGVIIENKGGRQAILAEMIVDATGDADVVHFAQAPYLEGIAPMTMMFNMVGVNSEEALSEIGDWSNVPRLLAQAIDRKEVHFKLGTKLEEGAPGVSIENLVYPGEVNIWSGNLLNTSGIKPDELTEAEIITREHAHILANWLKKSIKGFENARIEMLSTQVGVRKSRQIKPAELVSDGTVCKPYATASAVLPYSSLVPQRVNNLLVAGRCVFAREDRYGGQFRLIPACLATGQSAGIAAALALARGITPAKLDVSLVQKTIVEHGQDLGV
jgi:hypothetical protein